MKFLLLSLLASSLAFADTNEVTGSACISDQETLINKIEEHINKSDVIKKNCTFAKPRTSDLLSTRLEKLQTDYKTVDQRYEDRMGYLSLMDDVIRISPFANLLSCRDQLSTNPEISYELGFQDPSKEEEPMSVAYNYEDYTKKESKLALKMSFKLKTSVQMALFTYLHELTHVCQAKKSKELRVKLLKAIEDYKLNGNVSAFVKVKDEYYQYNSFIEVEAFYNMQLAYRFFTEKSSRLCFEESNLDPEDSRPYYENYLEGEKNLEEGNFSQAIIYGYHLNSPNLDDEKSSLFDLTSPQHTYVWNNTPEGKATMPSLHPSLKKMVESFGITVKEP